MPRSRSRSASSSDGDNSERRRYVTWDGEAAEVLLRLRFVTMQRAFTSGSNSLEASALWTTLATYLKRLTRREFTTTQCQGKLKALRVKWRVDMQREGKRVSPDDFEKHAIEWITDVNAQKRAKDSVRGKPRRKKSAAETEASFAELLASLEAPSATLAIGQESGADEGYEYGFGDGGYNDDQDDGDEEEQAAQVRRDESSLLELLRRQTNAVEAISNLSATAAGSQSQQEEWLAISREQTQLAREQVELNLFLIRADPEDAVAHEYLMLKRRQARDRLKREVAAREQRDTRAVLAAQASRVPISRLAHAL